jgi:hypothetical protein
MSTKFTIEMMSAEQITEYIKSQKDSEYSYYICGASLHDTQQPETGTEFDEIDFSSLNYPTSNEEDLFFPQLIIGYKNDQLTATLQQGYYVENGFVKDEDIKSIEISVDDAAKLMMKLSSVYDIINVFGFPLLQKK